MTISDVHLFIIFCEVARNGECRYHVGCNHCPLQQNYDHDDGADDNDDDYAGKNDDDADADGDNACHPERFAGKRRGERRTAKACAK